MNIIFQKYGKHGLKLNYDGYDYYILPNFMMVSQKIESYSFSVINSKTRLMKGFFHNFKTVKEAKEYIIRNFISEHNL